MHFKLKKNLTIFNFQILRSHIAGLKIKVNKIAKDIKIHKK